MNKEEFFSELKECLQGEVSENEYRDSISYYRTYFQEQEALGKSDAEIVSELGNARIIAHSIIDAHGLEDHSSHARENYDADSGYHERYRNTGGSSGDSYRHSGEEIVTDQDQRPVNHVLSQIGRTLAVIAVLLAVGVVLRFLLPVIMVVIVAYMIMNMFQRL